jgi:salicylate 5-hydroxylase large subunit
MNKRIAWIDARTGADAVGRNPFTAPGTHRIPNAVYSDAALHERELDAFFYRGHWCYVALECEIPNAGDYKATMIGERPVIVVRDRDGTINVIENRCAHKGAKFCQKEFGNAKVFVCPYHQWGYRLNGELAGVPMKNGVAGNGGMPADFKLEAHSIARLKCHVHNGIVFASFDQNVEPFEQFVSAELMPYFQRTFDGRKLTLLGYNRQRIRGNWKLMQENIKDPYHPGLLHVFFVTFGLWRADQKSELRIDPRGRHAQMISTRNSGGENKEVTAGVTSFKQALTLEDTRLIDVAPEPWWGGPTAVMQTIFPSVIIQQQVNSLSTRQIIPRGPDAFDFVWTHFGFADDTPEMTERRLKQANLFGPAGLVSLDDGEVIEYCQSATTAYPDGECVVELGGRDGGEATPHMVTETLIRGMYRYYRETMGF